MTFNDMETIQDKDISTTYDTMVVTNTTVKKDKIEGPLDHINDYEQEVFSIIRSYFEGNHLRRLVRHQLESYNHFIEYQIHRTVAMFNDVVIHSENDYVQEKNKYFLEIIIRFENLLFHSPQIFENNGATKTMFPQEARLRNFTYNSNMTIDLHIQTILRDTEDMEQPKIFHKVLHSINIGKMPIMLNSILCLQSNQPPSSSESEECPLDPGGYFIIKGSEKTVLGQERAAENRIYCFDGKNTTKWNWYAEINSIPDFKCISPKQIKMFVANKQNEFGNGLYIQIPRVKQPVELFVLFRALGVLSDKKICQYIVLDTDTINNREIMDYLKASIKDGNKFMTMEDAIRHITSSVLYSAPISLDKEEGMKKKRDFTMEVLTNDIFPHCITLEQKLYQIGYMAKKLIETAKGWRQPDDRDSYINKRVELTGTLINNLFRNYFNKLVKEMQKMVIKEINGRTSRTIQDYENIITMTNIYKLIKSSTIENGINRALSTGDFSVKQSNSSKVGVGQVLNVLNYPAKISHLRRVNTPLEKSGELVAPRKLHGTTWGFLCGVETPEGQSIGIVKNISCLAHITIPTNSAGLYDLILPNIHTVETSSPTFLYNKVKVFINGSFVGVTTDPIVFYNDLKQKKYSGIINIYTSIVFDFKQMEIRVCNDGGRLTRPLLRMDEQTGRSIITSDIIERLKKKEIGWNDLLITNVLPQSVIEYVDVEEQSVSMIYLEERSKSLSITNYRYTHSEIHPSTIFGILASCIPFPEHNQAPRNTYECLDLNELVWMADGTKKPIKDIELGDKVLSFHPTTFAVTVTNVVRHFIIPNQRKRYRIFVATKGSVIATEDHKFMTDCGWKQVSEIIEGKKNGIYQCVLAMLDSSVRYHRIMKIVEEKDGLVSDIEVESENHSFIVGSGFMSSNCAQLKQAIGVSCLNYDKRMDKTAYKLEYPSRSLVDTQLMNFIGMHRAPSGCQIHVAIMILDGFNQEDSNLINQGSIDRGMFLSTIYHTEKDEDKNTVRDEIIRCKPDKSNTKGFKYGNYEKLNSQGFIPENTKVENRDIIIAKKLPIKENRNDPTKIHKYEDQSRVYRTTEESYIDKNYTGRNGDGYNFAKTRVRILRKPMIGDKFSSKHGQKSTCGRIISECDMPFTKDGMRPDIIINPHAIPSRMTIGQLKETVLGKVLIELGFMGDGTAFGGLTIETICQQLQQLGYNSRGNEIMYNGLTGEQFQVSTFFGPVYYQRLKHMVNDKQHSRGFGPMVNLTRQPAEGRARDGGFRVGEMERDVLLAHGMSRFTKERLLDVSDIYHTYVCKRCGMIAQYNNGDNPRLNKVNDNFVIHHCSTCNNMTEFSMVEIPYAYKLLSQELQTINVVPRIITE